MQKTVLLLGIIATGSIIATILWPRTQAIAQPSSDPLCQMTSQDGQSLDLSHLCGKSNGFGSVISIDPNTPIPVQLVGSDKPSELWHTLPDLPTPPQAGKTQPVAPGSLPNGVAEPAVAPN